MQAITTEQKEVLFQLKKSIADLTPKTPVTNGKLVFNEGEKEVRLEWEDGILIAASIWTQDHRRASIRKYNPSWILRAFGFEHKFETGEELFKFLAQLG